jgi:glycosyltransferase involved in cell wall biosynthesis
MAILVSAILAKNEAARYLPQVLLRCNEFSDRVLVLDDRSTDETAEVAHTAGALVRQRSILKDPAWGKESPARIELWK